MSQNNAILNYLKQGKKLDPLKALKKFGCFRLSARIFDLTQMGYNIKCTNISKNGKHFAEYQLIQ
tara:strand:- start:46 stop:240 length:195 start_codon:yes stop_codon:yes gene_type:complete